jgi:hypothetical protein
LIHTASSHLEQTIRLRGSCHVIRDQRGGALPGDLRLRRVIAVLVHDAVLRLVNAASRGRRISLV